MDAIVFFSSSIHDGNAELASIALQENALELQSSSGSNSLMDCMYDNANYNDDLATIIAQAYSQVPSVAVKALPASRTQYEQNPEMKEFVYRMVRHIVLDRRFPLSKVLS